VTEPAKTLPALVRAVSGRIEGWQARRAVAAFFRLPYAERVAAIQEFYAHRNMKASFERYFAGPDCVAAHPQPFYDLILAYAEALRPVAILQVGCFTALESRFLALRGCPARIVASDYDEERLAYLGHRFAGTRYERIERRRLDLENARPSDLDGFGLVVCNAVLSNIQPEGLERFLAAVAASEVRALILSDVYTQRSLTRRQTRSEPSAVDRNWFHPYPALAARHGLGALFLPDFTASSFAAARGIFVLHRAVPQALHGDAAAAAVRSYLARQGAVWAGLETQLPDSPREAAA
jgi:methyltransferase family protein